MVYISNDYGLITNTLFIGVQYAVEKLQKSPEVNNLDMKFANQLDQST